MMEIEATIDKEGFSGADLNEVEYAAEWYHGLKIGETADSISYRFDTERNRSIFLNWLKKYKKRKR